MAAIGATQASDDRIDVTKTNGLAFALLREIFSTTFGENDMVLGRHFLPTMGPRDPVLGCAWLIASWTHNI